GSFVRNIAIRTVNPNGNPNPPDEEINEDQSPDIRVLTQDFGWQGDGFWFHGAGVTVEDNVVSGASGHGFIYWTLGLVEKGLGENLVRAGNLPNGDLIGGPDTLVRTKQVPVPSFDGNSTYSAPKGLVVAYLHTDNRDDNDDHFVGIGALAPVPQAYEDSLQSTFSNYTAWNVPLSAVSAPYSGRLTFDGIDILGTGAEGSIGIKLDQFANQNDITVRDITVDGYLVGVAAQRQGEAIIDGATISAPTGIRISAPNTNARNLEIGNVQFLPPSDLFEPGEDWVRIDMNEAFDVGLAGGLFGIDEFFYDEATLLYVPPIFQKDRITLDTPGYENVGLYFDSQKPNFVPIPASGELAPFVRSELVGLTNAQLQRRFGISFSDAVWPTQTLTDPLVPGGRIGAAQPSFDSVPSPSDAYWIDYLTSLGVYPGPTSGLADSTQASALSSAAAIAEGASDTGSFDEPRLAAIAGLATSAGEAPRGRRATPAPRDPLPLVDGGETGGVSRRDLLLQLQTVLPGSPTPDDDETIDEAFALSVDDTREERDEPADVGVGTHF
ncbi:MAG: hypothetical protein AAGI53_17855, partial [Planctomycetota bacterium]